MEYVYAALLLHKLGKPIEAEAITKIITAAGGQADESKAKSLVASLKGVDIDKVLSGAAIMPTVTAPTTESSNVEKKEEKRAEESAEGLSALFG